MKFEDLIFENKYKGFSSRTDFGHLLLSVQCGYGNYCEPRETKKSVDDYFSFEIAIINKDDGSWETSNYIETDDQVAGWVTRSQINEVIDKLKVFLREEKIKDILDET